MLTGAPAVLKTFPCERNPVDIFLKKLKLTYKNPNVENFLRSRKVEWILRVKVSEVA